MPQLVALIVILVAVKLILDYFARPKPKSAPTSQGDFIDISKNWIKTDELPYQKNGQWFGRGELSVWQMLTRVLAGSPYSAYPHIHLSALLAVPPGIDNRQEYQYRINQRSLDILVADADTQPLAGIIFNSSGDDPRQQMAQQFTSQALQKAGLGVINLDLDALPTADQLLGLLRGQGVKI